MLSMPNQGEINRYHNLIRVDSATKTAAIMRRTITYTELGYILNTFSGSGVMNRALFDLVELNKERGEPFFSSLVISNVTNQPGQGFFSACHSVGARYKDKGDFVNQQQLASFKYEY